MPIVLRIDAYAFGFFASDRTEPPHVHVRCRGKNAKFWLNPVSVASKGRFRPHELTRVEALIRENEARLLEAWHEYFNR